jgi:hypothetical protein
MGFLGGLFGGGKKGGAFNSKTMSTLSPQQQQLMDRLMRGSEGGIDSSLSYLSRLAGGDQSMFEEMEAPAMRQFGQMQGDIANRFSGAGMGQNGMSARKGSGHANAQNSAASSFAEQMAGKRMGLQQSAVEQLMAMSQGLLNRQTQENIVSPKRNMWGDLFGALGGGAGASMPYWFGK